MKATCYARKVSPVQDVEMWEGYIIRVLRSLRSADKANWHHRMVARVSGPQELRRGMPNA